ncbi:hypothetical protein PT2222_290089 [Paraburkholderia tropica]
MSHYGDCGTGYGGSGLWIWDFGARGWGFEGVDMGARSPGMGKMPGKSSSPRLWEASKVAFYGTS